MKKDNIRFIIVTGMSGAGKSSALNHLEDIGFFCVDNLPVQLVEKFADLSYDVKDTKTEPRNVAVDVDIRSGALLEELNQVFQNMRKKHQKFEILFLDASDDVIIKRFKETRRTHPASARLRMDEAIAKERKELEFLRRQADFIVDTSMMYTKDLKNELDRIFIKDIRSKNMFINIMSFGFKHGIPLEADLVFDVRFMPNPYYVPALKPRTGNEKPVRDYVMSSSVSTEFVDKLVDMMKFLIPLYIEEGKLSLTIGIGCTGGKHRSVTMAHKLSDTLKELGYKVNTVCRDVDKK
jgi:UPF0042 nucleotide-binding protein